MLCHQQVPSELTAIITDSHVHSRIRQYNAALALASIGYNGDAMSRNNTDAPNRPHVDGYGSLKISGRTYHLIGGLQPSNGQSPRWGQLFMFDAAEATQLRVATTRCIEHARPDVLSQLHALLLQHNQWVAEFAAAGSANFAELSWSSEDVSTRSGIVAVRATPGARNIVVKRHNASLLQISDQHPLYFPLAYVLLWPAGGVGYSDYMSRRDPASGVVIGKMHMLEWARYLCMRRSDTSLIHRCGKLSLEFFCDVWSCVEGRNLGYLATGAVQSQFRTSRYCAFQDQMRVDNGSNINRVGAPIILPAHFAGSPRWYHALYHDALALPAAFHLPDLFVTVTFNPEWPELARMMPAHGNVHDHADVVARVFWMRFSRIMKDIFDHGVFGEVLSYCYRIEWQLRGFPHAHVLLILKQRILSAAEVDRFVSAEIPDPVLYPELHRLVLQLMIHGPCDTARNAPCVVDGVCEKSFPKQLQHNTVLMSNAYPLYKRRGLIRGHVRGNDVNDAWVVPYNPFLLARHRSHINVEVASHLILYKYVYKYCFKPPDHGAININEIAAYISGRTLSSAEAMWRILQLPLHKEYPPVQRLQVHLPGHHMVVFDAATGADAANAVADASTSTLLQWFALNSQDPAARTLLYKDVSKRYKWDVKLKKWVPRTFLKRPKVARMHGVSPHNIELFMLRRLLLVVPGAQSFEDLRTVDRIIHPTFEAAVRARGMMEDDDEIYTAFDEVVLNTVSDSKVRRLFVMYLVYCRPAQPITFFERFRLSLFPPSSDSQHAWQELVAFATEFRTSLQSHGIHPPPSIPRIPVRLIEHFDSVQSGECADSLWIQLNDEQRATATLVMNAVATPRGEAARVMMLQASGGCGKSFVCNYIASRVRSRGLPAVCVAASAQAASVLAGGRTAHGQLHIPIDCDETSYCDLSVKDKLELEQAAVLIWDEASMVSDAVADCVDRSLQDIFKSDLPFGGMPVLFVGDFRQLLPVVQRSRGEHHTIQKCGWWKDVRILRLQQNWRCQQPEWLQLLDDVGMGRCDVIEVPAVAVRPTVDDVIAHVWSDAALNPTDSKAVLTLTLEDAAMVNSTVIGGLPGASTLALSVDTYVDCKEPDMYPEDFVRGLFISGVPPGQLELKVGGRYIIIRNIDQQNGIVNGAHILCTSVTQRHVIGAASMIYVATVVKCCSHALWRAMRIARTQWNTPTP